MRSNVQIQLLPYTAGVGFDGSFVILDFPPMPAPYPDAAEERMVYVDTLTGALYLERPGEIAAYAAAHEQLQALALAPKPTRDTLRAIAADLNCVEVATPPQVVKVRDSKDRQGPVLSFTADQWIGFIEGIKAGTLAA